MEQWEYFAIVGITRNDGYLIVGLPIGRSQQMTIAGLFRVMIAWSTG